MAKARPGKKTREIDWTDRFVFEVNKQLRYLERIKNILRQLGLPESAIGGDLPVIVERAGLAERDFEDQEDFEAAVTAWGMKWRDEHPRRFTELLTKQELAKAFGCHRNQVDKLVLARYRHEKVGERFRMPVDKMPAEWRPKRNIG